MTITRGQTFSKGDVVTNTKLHSLVDSASISGIALSALSLASTVAGDILVTNGTTFGRLPIGTAGQKLKAQYDTYTKLMMHCNGVDGTVSPTDEIGKTVTNTATYDSYTKVCSHFDGSDGDVAYTDPIAGAYTFEGTAQLDTAQKKFGTASLLLDGNSDYVTLPDDMDWYFGTGDFTIDFWFRTPDVTGDYMVVSQYADADNKWFVRINNNIIATAFTSSAADKGAYDTSASCGMVNDTWYHIAIVRSTTTCKIFVDGVSKTLTTSTAFGTNDVGNVAAVLSVGAYNSGYYLNGWIDELRISKGIARWTSNFTVPAYPYGQAVISTTQKKFGTASAYFDGDGSNLTLADSADWDFGTGNFTIDFWIYNPTDNGNTYQGILQQYQDGSNLMYLTTKGGGGIQFGYAAGGVTLAAYASDANNLISYDTWTHVAFCRIGTGAKLFINGVEKAMTASTAFGSNDLTGIGAVLQLGYWTPSGQEYFKGNIDEFRVSKGIARWTADFTVPSAAYLPSVTWVT